MERIYTRTTSSPFGDLQLTATERGLRSLHFLGREPKRSGPDWIGADEPFREVLKQLEAYFAGRRKSFDLDLDLRGTAFQLRVWSQLLKIPYGETASYGDIARRIGKPKACRAVGGANHANPIAVIVPCHRVIGSTGKLTGYGGGSSLKRSLLALEGVTLEGAGQQDLFSALAEAEIDAPSLPAARKRPPKVAEGSNNSGRPDVC